MVKWSKLSKARVFRGQEKKIDNKILHRPGLYPQFIFACGAIFHFFALQKRVRWKLDFYTVPKIFCLRRHLYYFFAPQKSANASPFIGGSTGSTGYRTPESTSLACTRLPRRSVYAGTKSLPHPNNIQRLWGSPCILQPKCN